MRLRDSLLSFSVVSPATLRMVLRFRGFLKSHLAGIAVFLAVNTLAPARMSASIQRPLSPFEQEVVSTIRAHDKIARSVVGAGVVHMVDFFLSFEEAAERAFSHKDVLVDVARAIGVRMTGSTFKNVSVRFAVNSPAPIRVVLQKHSRSMAFANQQRLTLANAVTSPVPSATSERSREATPAPTNTRRIYQSCAPIACAVSTFNLTLFRRAA